MVRDGEEFMNKEFYLLGIIFAINWKWGLVFFLINWLINFIEKVKGYGDL